MNRASVSAEFNNSAMAVKAHVKLLTVITQQQHDRNFKKFD